MSRTLDILHDEYFEWLYNKMCGNRFPKGISYRKLLVRLHDIEFTYLLEKDENRAEDGVNLRYRFAITRGYSPELVYNVIEAPCSVLEMMIALAIRCEETIMDDADIGDRTKQWFWGMIHNLGFSGMKDERFDSKFVDDVIARFLNRQYEPNGSGGLFTIKNSVCDLREVEIWYQLCWYLDTIV